MTTPRESQHIQSPLVRLRDDVLLCPLCGEENLHHQGVRVYERDKEDAERGRVVTVARQVTVSREEMDGNPSSRRDGLKIVFCCEHCVNSFELRLSQHKGSTYLSWWYADPQDERGPL